MKTNKFFKPGKLTVLMDGQFGSSGKGKVGSYVTQNADNWTFTCNAFMPQAGHWVRLKNGKEYFYQTFNSNVYQDNYDKCYIGPASVIELPAFFREKEENNIPSHKIGVSPVASILLDIDSQYERGTTGFDGDKSFTAHSGTMMKGSTAHGCGSAVARKALRKSSVVLAKDVPELKEFICDVPNEILGRLGRGESGLLELAQGFPLSLHYSEFYPHTTSRNVTTAQAASDMFLPPNVLGPLIINFRTYPIRINNRKFIGNDGAHLSWAQVMEGVPHTVLEGNSGHWYPDQTEMTWEKITELSGSKTPIFEITSVTKLPRRVATFSIQNMKDVIKFNNTGDDVHISVNFANYVDAKMLGATSMDQVTKQFDNWVTYYLDGKMPSLIGTGMYTDDMILNG
jgi:adenylosuccinate synthase